jgi:hypothetical protein
VAWLSGLNCLGTDSRQDDFPSIAAGTDGTIWTVWASYSGLYDEIHARTWRNGSWSTIFPIPGVTGDVWMPQVALDGSGGAWFVWAQQAEYPPRDPEHVNWDLYAARYEGGRWNAVQRLTNDPEPDMNPRLKRDARGRVWLAWQGFRNGQSQIFLRYAENGKWSDPYQISSGEGNNWYPDVAADSHGVAHIVWDVYRNENYDILARDFENGNLGAPQTIAGTLESEANASITVDKQDREWISYDQMGVNWSKDQGAAIRTSAPGIAINHKRELRVVVRTTTGLMEPVEQPSASMPPGAESNNHLSRLYTDGDGRVWIVYRHKTERPATWSRPWQVQTEQAQNMAAMRGFWQTYATYYDKDHWIPGTQMPHSMDRISSYADAVSASNGQMWMIWHTDNRPDDQVQIPRKNDVWVGVLTPATSAEPADLKPAQTPKIETRRPGHLDELGDVRAIRAHRVMMGGVPYQIVRGDLHRHTELSTDGGGRNDGSLVDFFRYMIDAASMDFGAVTDHNAGGDNEYWWWYINKLTDLYFVPNHYVALFGYERSATFPNGHRNIITTIRNTPVVKFHFKPGVPEYWSTYEAVSRDMVENETKLLYEQLRSTGSISIPHTSATNMGTDWRDNDRQVEPVVEIYQGARNNYEHEGAPRSVKPPADALTPQSQYRREGLVWNAWNKGYRIGTTSSSDHGSTHISYSMVYTPKDTRVGILDAIRQRHTYGATDNIVLEFWMGDHFMGDEFHAPVAPPIRVKVWGTGKIAKIKLIRNAKYIYETEPNQREAKLEYQDASPDPGVNYYYARIEQEDGQLAWASPIWMNLTR